MGELTLLAALACVPDPRLARGKIHPLTAILSLTVVAMLAGCTTLTAIAQFGRDRPLLAPLLGFRRYKTPNKSALSKLFRRLNLDAFEAVLSRWLTGRLPEHSHLALDGKTLRGSATGDLPGVHLLSVFAPEVAGVVAQMRVDAKTNEHKAALELLGVLPLTGHVLSADAMFCHRDVCDTIVDGGGDYVLVVDDNQPTLKSDIQAAFALDAVDFSPLSAATCRV